MSLQHRFVSGEWFCPTDASQYGNIVASQGSCKANIGFTAGTAKPLSLECDMQFKGASSQIYGGALLKFVEILKACPKVKSPAKKVVKAEKLADRADQKVIKLSKEDIEIKSKEEAGQSLRKELQTCAANSVTDASKANTAEEKQVLDLVKQSLDTAIKAINHAFTARAEVISAREVEYKRVEANKALAAKETAAKDASKWNWKCPDDKEQKGSIKAIFEKCDPSVSFSSGTKGQLKVSPQT